MRVELKEESAAFIKDWMPGSGAERYVTAAYVTAKKPLALPLALAARLVAWGVPGVSAFVELAASVLLSRVFGLAVPRFLRKGALRRALGRPTAAAAAEPPKAAVAEAKPAAATKKG